MAKSQIRQDPTSSLADSGRETRLQAALFHGAGLTLENPAYFQMLRTLTEQLLRADREPQDLTCAALGIAEGRAQGSIIANDSGVLAGIDEACWFYSHFGLKAERRASDGQEIHAGQELLHLQGDAVLLLSLERDWPESTAANERNRHGDTPPCEGRALPLAPHARNCHTQDALGPSGQARRPFGWRRHAPPGAWAMLY